MSKLLLLLNFSGAKAGDLLLYYHWGVDSNKLSSLDFASLITNIDWHNGMVDILNRNGKISSFYLDDFTTHKWKLVKAKTT